MPRPSVASKEIDEYHQLKSVFDVVLPILQVPKERESDGAPKMAVW